ncbi:MAG: EAL domain-containing protein [Nautiliaceae bacterium]
MREFFKRLSEKIYNKFYKKLHFLIFITPIVSILITTFIIMGVAYLTLKENYYHQRQVITQNFMENLKKVTKQRVELAYNVIDAIYKSNSGKSNQKELTIKLMQQILDKMRWGKKGYIFVIDFHGNTLYHPNKEFMKINRWNLERGGVKVIQLLTKNALAHPEGTYVRYLAYNPEGKRPLWKISYVKVFKPLKFFIGSGVYLDTLDERLLKQQRENERLFVNLATKLLKSAIIITIVMIILMGVIAYMVRRIFEKYEFALQQEKEFLFQKATHDRLTGLCNREAFIDFLRESLKEGKHIGVLFIDLDGFKEINDTLGHYYGDKILKDVAKRLKEVVGNKGKISRFGGDEFVVLVEGNKSKVEEVAKSILEVIKKPFYLEGKIYHLTASIGISLAPFDTLLPEELLKNADTAMYKVKQGGKNRFEFFTKEMSKAAQERIYLRNVIYQLLKNDGFLTYFQPQMDKNDKLYGSEVLLRAKDPNSGEFIPPFKIIPLAIELGVIYDIDFLIMKKAIQQYKEWEEKGLHPGVISCNVTMHQLEKENFVEDLKKLLKEFDFDPKKLNIEITEESIMKKPDISIRTLNKVSELGVGVNIDDFGTGYSSLSYLKKLPLSKLKIDRSFIKDIPQDKDDIIITMSIITLAKSLNLEVVAEGVENEVQKRFVFENGCDLAQGYYYSPPLDAKEFEEKFLKDKRWF